MTLNEMESIENTIFERAQEYLDVRQMLDLEVTGWLDGKTLSCAVDILFKTEDAFSTNVTFFVKGVFLD